MVSMQDSETRGLGFRALAGVICVVFLGKIVYSHSAYLHAEV